MSPLRVAVVGATGAVGSEMLALLAGRSFPATEIVPFASERSAGRELPGGLVVVPLRDDTIAGFDIAIFSAGGAVSGEWAPRFADAGAIVVDNSSRWRMDPDVPLVVSEVNPEAIDSHPKRIVANPNCSTMQLMVALKPVQDAAGIERIVVSTYQSVSGTGVKAIDELRAEAQAALAGEDHDHSVYPYPIAFNVIGGAGSFAEGDDWTDEERKMLHETRKILGDQSIGVAVTCVRVPVVTGHSEAVNVQTREPIDAARVRDLLQAAPGITVVDDPSRHLLPTPLDAAGRDDVLVGRIRDDESHPRAFSMFVVADNLRKGAATNAVQLAELLVERGHVGAAKAAA